MFNDICLRSLNFNVFTIILNMHFEVYFILRCQEGLNIYAKNFIP